MCTCDSIVTPLTLHLHPAPAESPHQRCAPLSKRRQADLWTQVPAWLPSTRHLPNGIGHTCVHLTRSELSHLSTLQAKRLAWHDVLLVLVCTLVNVTCFVTTIGSAATLLQSERWYWAPGMLIIWAGGAVREFVVLWRSTRRLDAILQLLQITLIKDTYVVWVLCLCKSVNEPTKPCLAVFRYSLVVQGRTHGVVVDIRNNTPVFGLQSIESMKRIHGQYQGFPLSLVVGVYLMQRAFPVQQPWEL